MIGHKSGFVTLVLIALGVTTVVAVRPAVAQTQRGYGINTVVPRSSFMRSPSITQTPRTMYSPRYNTGGPLSFGNTGLWGAGPIPYDFPMPYFSPYDSLGQGGLFMEGDLSLEGDMTSSTSRPNVRPRLNLNDRNSQQSMNILRSIRDTVVEQIAGIAEKPFTESWFAAHTDLPPIGVQDNKVWTTGDWPVASQWVGVTAEPLRYDFRADATGLIHVFLGPERQGRAVDARGPAGQLSDKGATFDSTSAGLSLGVFAAVPPVDEPVKSLVHLVVDKSGRLAGYEYEIAANAMKPLRGSVDPTSQRVAWRVENTVVEAGFKNLTEDAARALVFFEDGWTQPWILIRLPELPAAAPAGEQEKQPAEGK
ncbi:MAG: hypothetical protein FJ276_14190 [Planctomycetes bacterium]|nr:hypothetical protein [Planctomycetota bacterium]